MIENYDIELEMRKFISPEFVFGIDSRFKAANFCKKLGARKIFLATDSRILKTFWFVEILTSLQKIGLEYTIFSAISPNPRDFEVMAGSEIYKQEKCNLILAVGGGSVIDCAKGVGIVVSNLQHIRNFEGVDMFTNPIPPMVCVPSTAGASSDVSQFAIINNFEGKYKMVLISKALVPDVSILDPLVLTTKDSYLTACNGMNALSHAIEAYVSSAASEFNNLHALEAIRLINNNFVQCLSDLNNLQFRAKMMLASLYAGLAFSNASLGCVHSMSHSLGGFLDLSHGECNAILLPHVVDFNFSSASYKYRKIAEVLNLNTLNSNDNEVKQKLINYLLNLKEKVNIKTSLKTKGVSSDLIPTLASNAINDPCNATNPRPPKRKDLETIFTQAM